MFALGLMASMVPVLTSPEPASAALRDFHPATWNMQGGSNAQDSKWTTDVVALMRRGYNVISLQEAGPAAPPTARLLNTYRGLGRTVHHGGWDVNVYEWTPGSARQWPAPWRIYFMRTQTGGDRVNLAFVTDRAVTAIDVAPPNQQFYNGQGQPTARPALGLTFGDTQFWNVHALSGNGNDGRGLVENISRRAGWRHWAAMGDWNRVPERQEFGLNRYIYRSHEETHDRGNELDYMVSNENVPGYGGATTRLSSDHRAVGFHRLEANAGVQLLNLHDHNQYIGSVNASYGTPLVSSGYPDLKHWRFVYLGGDDYNIVNDASHFCMSDNNGHLIQWGCNGAPDQKFKVYYWLDNPGQIQLRPSARAWQCVGDDNSDGFGTWIRTDDDCHSGKTRLGVRYDYDPGPDAAPVFI